MSISYKNLGFIITIMAVSQYVSAQIGQGLVSNEEPIYSHQYTFSNDDQYYFIDTSFNNLHWYHQFNNQGDDLFDYVILGSMGTPGNRLTEPEAAGIWSYYTLGAYDLYMQKSNAMVYYSTRSPITEANYWMGYDRGQSFNINHTQNITKDWNLTIGYNRLNDLGYYTHNRNLKSKFTTNTSFVNDKWSYKAKAHFFHEKMLNEENGGIVYDTALEVTDERVLLNVNLNDDTRLIKNVGVFTDQSIDLLKLASRILRDSTVTDSAIENKKEALLLGHRFKYSKKSNTYNAFASTAYYENYYYEENNEYEDSSGYQSFANTLYVRTELGQRSKLNVELGIKGLSTHYGGNNFSVRSSNLGFSGMLEGNLKSRVSIKANLDYVFIGSLSESFDVGGVADLNLFKKVDLYGKYRLISKYPEFFDALYYSNNYIWNNNFDKELTNKLSVGLRWGDRNFLEVSNTIYQDMIYYNVQSLPEQSNRTVNVSKVSLSQNFTFWQLLHQDNKIYYQILGGASEIMPLPELVTRNSLYFEFRMFKNVLTCLAGAELKYYSSYLSPSYNPAISRFYVANEMSLGNYPVVDLFLNFKLKTARIFIKYEHINEGMNGYNYFAAPHYPIPDRVLRFGLTWRFFN